MPKSLKFYSDYLWRALKFFLQLCPSAQASFEVLAPAILKISALWTACQVINSAFESFFLFSFSWPSSFIIFFILGLYRIPQVLRFEESFHLDNPKLVIFFFKYRNEQLRDTVGIAIDLFTSWKLFKGLTILKR